MTSATVYVRISEDTTGLGLGVERQEAECRALCAALGFEVREVITDNDVSATRAKVRPGFERLLTSQPEAVVVWHTDRLVRLTRDLERVIDLGVAVHAVQAGHLDLATASGRAVARTVTAWATYEGEVKAARQKSANRQRAVAGKGWWPVRPFGIEFDGTGLVEPEAAALRKAYTDVLDGAPLASVARDWNAAGLLTPKGKTWRATSVRTVLLNARNAGLREYDGEIVGAAAWPAIVSEDTWRAAVAVLTAPERGPGGGRRSSLLTGVAVCGLCGGRIGACQTNNATDSRGYRCRDGFHNQKQADPLDALAARAAVSLLVLPGAREVLTEDAERPDADALRAERATLTARRDVELPQALAAGLSVAQVAEASRTINERIEAINAALVRESSADTFGAWWSDGPENGDISAEVGRFEGLPLHRRTAILNALFDSITVVPGRGGTLAFEPSALALGIGADLADRLDNLASLAVEKVAGHTFDEDAAKAASARFKRL